MAGNDNIFERTLDNLRAEGWFKGHFWRNSPAEGPSCIRGAAFRVNGLNPLDLTFYDSLKEIIYAEYPERVIYDLEDISQFNDHPDTTFADVERVLEKAAVKWEEERVLRD